MQRNRRRSKCGSEIRTDQAGMEPAQGPARSGRDCAGDTYKDPRRPNPDRGFLPRCARPVADRCHHWRILAHYKCPHPTARQLACPGVRRVKEGRGVLLPTAGCGTRVWLPVEAIRRPHPRNIDPDKEHSFLLGAAMNICGHCRRERIRHMKIDWFLKPCPALGPSLRCWSETE